MGRKRLSALLLTLLTVISVFSPALTYASAASKDIVVAVYPNEPLVSFNNENAEGFLVDLVDEIAKEENWNIEYRKFNFDEGLTSIENSDVDLMIGVAWSEARAERFDYNQESAFVNWGQIYSNSKADIQSFQDLQGARIGVYKGDIHYIGKNGLKRTLEQFGIEVMYYEYNDKMDMFTDLESGFVDAVIVNRLFGMEHEGSFNITKTAIQLNPVNIHIIAPTEENSDVLQIVDHYLRTWKDDKNSFYYDRLMYWMESRISQQIPAWIWSLLGGFVGLLILSAGIIYVTQKIIRKQTAQLRELNHNLEDKVQERTMDLDATNQQLRVSLITLEEKQAELEEMNAILEEQVDMIERTQGQLIEAEKMASLGRMVASLAHELNTPVGICVTLQSNIKVDSQRMLKSLDDNKLTKNCLVEYLNDMMSVSDMFSNNLETVVNLVDRFKMLSSDRILMNERKVNLYEYLHTQMDALSPELKHSTHEYNIDCPKDIDMVVDPTALSQVIRNLTMNSLIHGFEDKPSGQIDINVTKLSERVLIEYSDNGKGILPDVKKKMFEPFFTTKRNQGGTGLGLSIVHSAVTQTLSGEIRVDERQRSGLKYEIELPLIEKENTLYSVQALESKMTSNEK